MVVDEQSLRTSEQWRMTQVVSSHPKKIMVPAGDMFSGGDRSHKLLHGPAGHLNGEQWRTINEHSESEFPLVPARYGSRQGHRREPPPCFTVGKIYLDLHFSLIFLDSSDFHWSNYQFLCFSSSEQDKMASSCRKTKNWSSDQWKSVLWSEESKFEIFGTRRRAFFRRKINETYKSMCIFAYSETWRWFSDGLGVF